MAGGGLVEVKAEGLEALLRALAAESDGKALRKELARNLRGALKPAQARARSSVMTIPSSGRHQGTKLRQQIARRIVADVRLTGRVTGARLKARKTPGVRSFANAPKRTQSRRGWEHPVFSTGVIVTQHGRTEWFDRATQAVAPEAREACIKAMEEMAHRIQSRVR